MSEKKYIILEPLTDKPVKVEPKELGNESNIVKEICFTLGEHVSNIIFTDKEVIVLGTPSNDESLPEDDWHNCDGFGCGQCHVLQRFSIPVCAEHAALKPIDILLFCPECGEQHVDEAAPNICEKCGHTKEYHGQELSKVQPNSMCLHCSCEKFEAWLNPPHKSHRCGNCNHVWRPADVPTNGVLSTKTRGENDGNPHPRYTRQTVGRF